MRHTVEEVRLPGGGRGLLIDVPDATVMSFQFQFRAGNRYVRDNSIYETAHLMEHMAFGANEKFKNEHEYEQEFTKNGAYHNAYTSDVSMVYESFCADFEWDRILDLQAIAICKPKFNSEELQAEKGNVRNELNGYLNNHNRVMWPRIQQALGEDVYTYSQRLKTISKVSLDDIKEHHARTHTLKNMRFIISGKLEGRKEAIIRNLESWDLPSGERFDIPRDVYRSASPVLIRRKEASNITFGLSLMLPRELMYEELDAMHCLNHILTGTMSSRIFGTARKNGLAYGIFSETSSGNGDSSWDFGGGVNIDNSKGLFDIISKQLKNVLNGDITEAELEVAKSYALGRYQMGAQTVAQVANFYNGRYFYNDEIKNYQQVPTSIASVTRDRMIETARDFVEANTWVMAGVGSIEKAELVELSDKIAEIFKETYK